MTFLLWLPMSLCLVANLLLQLAATPPTVTLRLIHRHANPHAASTPEALLDRVRDLVHGDLVRQERMNSRRLGEISGASMMRSMQYPLTSGRDYGVGEYVARVQFGTPPQSLFLIIDTGSDLTWTRCNKGGDSKKSSGLVDRGETGFMLLASDSSTFRSVSCKSHLCSSDFSSNGMNCPGVNTPCSYNISYQSGEYASGSLATETATVEDYRGKQTTIPNLLIGCTDDYHGVIFKEADGVLGMMYETDTFVDKVTQIFNRNFSYCLVDHLKHRKSYSYLIFGRTDRRTLPLWKHPMRYTKLNLVAFPPFYALDISHLTVNGVVLNVQSKAWAITIMDSGTSITKLNSAALGAVVDSLSPFMNRFSPVNNMLDLPFSHCFNPNGFNVTSVPKLVIHFENMASFVPHPKSYFIDVADQVKCLGLLQSDNDINVIGNILQQNYFWEFDLKNRVLGFASSSCSV